MRRLMLDGLYWTAYAMYGLCDGIMGYGLMADGSVPRCAVIRIYIDVPPRGVPLIALYRNEASIQFQHVNMEGMLCEVCRHISRRCGF